MGRLDDQPAVVADPGRDAVEPTLQVDQLRWMARHHGRETAFVQLVSRDHLTFARWDATSNRLARGLVDGGLGVGDRVLVHLDDEHLDRWLITYAAVHKAGAVAVPVDVHVTADELGVIVAHAEPAAAITSIRRRPRLDRVRRSVTADHAFHVVEADDPASWLAVLADDDGPFQVPVGACDLAEILYTPGTTGPPKGVAVRHRDTHSIANGEPDWNGRSWLLCAPLSTQAGLTSVYGPMKTGMRGLFLPRFGVDAWIDAVEAWQPTTATLAPAMVQRLLDHPRVATADLTSLTYLTTGAAPLPARAHRHLAALLRQALVTNSYSTTEAGTPFTCFPCAALTSGAGSVGVPVPAHQIRIADDHGVDLACGAKGHVLVHVGEHHREYFRDPDATARTWEGRWLRSGDVGYIDDDGFLFIVGRAEDMVVQDGARIPSAEIEAVLHDHPGVLEAAVIGVPHEVRGEEVGAFVVAATGPRIDAEGLRRFCAEHLPPAMVPRHIWVTHRLPRNAAGHVIKRDLIPPG